MNMLVDNFVASNIDGVASLFTSFTSPNESYYECDIIFVTNQVAGSH